MPSLQANRIVRDAAPALRQIARTVATVTAPARPYADSVFTSVTFFGIGFVVGVTSWLLLREYIASPEGFASSGLMVVLTGLAAGTICGFAAMAVAATMQASRAEPPASLAHLPDPSPLALVGPLVGRLVAVVRRRVAEWRRADAVRRQTNRASMRPAASASSHSTPTRSTATRPRQDPGKRTASFSVVTSRAPKPAAKPSSRKRSSPRKR